MMDYASLVEFGEIGAERVSLVYHDGTVLGHLVSVPAYRCGCRDYHTNLSHNVVFQPVEGFDAFSMRMQIALKAKVEQLSDLDWQGVVVERAMKVIASREDIRWF